MAVRGWGIAAAASVGVTIAASIVGSVLESRGLATAAIKTGIVAVAIGAFVVLAVAIPPLAVRLFLAGQVAIGNAEHPIVAFMLRHETNVVRGVWVFMACGVAIMLPYILRDLGWTG